VGQRFRIGEIIHRYDVDVLIGECGAQHVSSDASKSINANFYGHGAPKENFVFPINMQICLK